MLPEVKLSPRVAAPHHGVGNGQVLRAEGRALVRLQRLVGAMLDEGEAGRIGAARQNLHA